MITLVGSAQHGLVSLNLRKTPLLQVLSDIEKQTGVGFSYSSDVVNIQKKITIKVSDVTLEQVLSTVFSDLPIGFKVQGNQVILYKKENYNVTISGYIREKFTGELLIGATVSTKPLLAGAVTNAYGFYSITLPADTYQLVVSYVGYQVTTQTILATSSQVINIALQPKNSFDDVIITATMNKKELSLNKINLSLQEIKDVPSILGERDVLKYMMLTSGVQKGNEGNAYVYVRGGGPDQNLIMIDDAIIYNAYHFLGLASLFTGNELRSAELYKGAFPSRYGGRLSSVLDLSMKDGSTQQFGADATIGAISSRLLVEGPIVKGKSSFLLSARKSYISQVASLVASTAESVLDYGYYDIHAKFSTTVGLRDRLMFSTYIGNDGMANNKGGGFEENQDGISWGNKAASLRWSHQFNSKLFGNTSLVYSYYKARIAYGETSDNNGTIVRSSTATESSINDYTLKHDLDYSLNSKHKFRFGFGYTNHTFKPVTSFTQYNPDSVLQNSNKTQANEAFGYTEWNYKLTQAFTINSGLRFSFYNTNRAYYRLEPRVNLQYNLPKKWQLAASYSLMNQYLHLLSTFNGLGMPSDVWLSSDEVLKPQRANVYTIGLVKNDCFLNGLSFSVEGYYKEVENAVTLKEGASFFQLLLTNMGSGNIKNFNQLTTQGKSWSYGGELVIRKSGKYIEGFISYTLSKTQMQFNEVNNGNAFLANYDRPNDLGVFVCYKPNLHWSFSANWVYGTGNAISLPTAMYFPVNNSFDGGGASYGPQYYYDAKNKFRMQSYHRLDLAAQYSYKIRKKWLSTFELSIYNIYNRANPFFYEITFSNDQNANSKRVLRKNSLFPIMPTICWSIKI